ncbi:EAL domain-containing protein [Mycobacterium sp. 050134]|uniref:EAL domain-containing protein n=1 Tax=Mycobacterium sp. 050134 TaxID=3096111 RepID=UPI002EDABD24
MPDSVVPGAKQVPSEGDDRAIADALGLAPTPYYQPIVSLPDGALVGFEALTRWPTLGNPDPDLVFDAATKAPATLEELDERCIAATLDTFLQSNFGSGAMLFVNTHPSCDLPGEAVDARSEELRARRIFLVFELTERQLLSRPRTLIRKVNAIRRRGWVVAFDDVGVNSASLPLLDVLRPEIVKLDMNLVRSTSRTHASQVMSAVLTYRERSNAVILAEGVETSDQGKRALAWGATLGQGHRFGHPGPLTTKRAIRWSDFKLTAPQRFSIPTERSPFDTLVSAGAEPREALVSTIQALTRHISVVATRPENPSIVLVVLPDDERLRLSDTGLRRVARAAPGVPFYAIFGHQLPEALADSGVRGVAVAPSDPLAKEMLILALGPHAAAAVVVHGFERDRVVDAESGLRYAVTYDRQYVTVIASHLLARIT